MSYQIELFHSMLNDFLQGESTLLTIEGDVLAIRGQNPTSYGTLPEAAKVVGKYLNLQEGDIAVLNDPYSGGSTLNEMTFVMAISEDLLWVSRRVLRQSIVVGKSVEEEGLRIPPTPLRQNGKMNEVILSAMQAHPACPSFFGTWIKAQIDDMLLQAKKLLVSIEATGFVITAELIEEYLELSKKLAHQKISEQASGETRVDIVLDSGELLRIKLEIQDGKISMDFGGSTAARTVHLTEAAAYGTCFYAISKHSGFNEYANSGSFSALQVTKPAGCWLMAKYPASTMKGMTFGVAALQSAIELALSNIHHKETTAPSCYSPLSVQLQKPDAQIVLRLHGGRGATNTQSGADAELEMLCVEMLEREFPLKVLRAERRQLEGKGKYSGGRGLSLKIEALGDLDVSWLSDLTLHKPRISKSCSHGDICEISLESSGDLRTLPVLGKQILRQGEILTLSSGSGGSYGKKDE